MRWTTNHVESIDCVREVTRHHEMEDDGMRYRKNKTIWEYQTNNATNNGTHTQNMELAHTEPKQQNKI